MKLHMKAISANGNHTRFIVFMNGGNCGELCMREDEALFFHNTIMLSNFPSKGDVLKSSGIWTKDKECDAPIEVIQKI